MSRVIGREFPDKPKRPKPKPEPEPKPEGK